jgi:hypothetical protein
VTTIRKITLTVLIAGLVAGVAAFGAFSAFSATTSNAGNSFASGTVAIADNDGGSTALYTSANAAPGVPTVSCITVTYTGSLASTVKLYASAGITGGAAIDLTVERGTTSTGFGDCTGFLPSSTAYTGALGSFPTDYATGVEGKAGVAPVAWATNDAIAYRFTVSATDDATANAHTTATSSGAHTFTWEARNT